MHRPQLWGPYSRFSDSRENLYLGACLDYKVAPVPRIQAGRMHHTHVSTLVHSLLFSVNSNHPHVPTSPRRLVLGQMSRPNDSATLSRGTFGRVRSLGASHSEKAFRQSSLARHLDGRELLVFENRPINPNSSAPSNYFLDDIGSSS